MSNWTEVTIEGVVYRVRSSGLVNRFDYDTEEKKMVWRVVRQIVLETDNDQRGTSN